MMRYFTPELVLVGPELVDVVVLVLLLDLEVVVVTGGGDVVAVVCVAAPGTHWTVCQLDQLQVVVRETASQ